jgi:hypothetical protein
MVNIPHELLEAAGKFRHWATDLMLSEQEDKKITQPLYHYTDATGLKGIVEKKEIWFTSHRYMNDPSEISFGIDAAHKAITRIPAHGPAQIFRDSLAAELNVQTITQVAILFGPKDDGTYVVEFRTAAGETLAISIRRTEAAVTRHFQERMPYGLFVPDVDAGAIR